MARTSLFSRHKPGGVFTIEDAGLSTGNRWFVDSVNGASTNGGNGPDDAIVSLDAAVALCTANNGDIIYVMPLHAETITAAVTLDVAGVTIVGLGFGRARPTFTGSGAIDVFTVTAANVTIENIRILGASASVTALINVAADDFSMRKCSLEAAATPVMSMTLASGHRGLIEDCSWLPSAAGADCAIDIESSGSDNWIVRNCTFNGTGSSGWDLGVIRNNVDTAAGWLIDNCTFLKCDTLAIDFNSSASVSDGVVRNCTFHATAALASIEDIVDPGGYHFFECYAHDGTNATTAGARIPLGTVS